MHCVRAAISVVGTLLIMPSARSLRVTANSFDAALEEHMVRTWWDKRWHQDHESRLSLSRASPEDEEAQEWWDNNASAGFQHIDEGYVSQQAHAWQKMFLAHFDWKNKNVLDYGIGGGFLGKVLFEEYGISHYTGVDISTRALDAAKANLEKYNTSDNVKLVLTPMQFSAVSPDIFVSQQVIQHFPSVSYFNNFLENVDHSNASQVMLHFRASPNGTTYSTDAYSEAHQDSVTLALFADKDFIAQHLKSYKLVWSDTTPMCCNTLGVYTGWDRK